MSISLDNTKDKFLYESLKLFAEKGFDAVSVAEIADSVGCTPPALYKHYESKQALWDAIIEKSNTGFSSRMNELKVNFINNEIERKRYVAMKEKEQIEVIKQLFLHTCFDEIPMLFRKMMINEQFHRPEIAKEYNKRYFDSQIDSIEALMKEFIKEGKIKARDARILAVDFISPIIIYVNVCDREPKRKDDALNAIECHIKEFNKKYIVN